MDLVHHNFRMKNVQGLGTVIPVLKKAHSFVSDPGSDDNFVIPFKLTGLIPVLL
jgi:hypothetical protein